MFKDFDISAFESMKPPSNNSFDTSQEIKELKKYQAIKSLLNTTMILKRFLKKKQKSLTLKTMIVNQLKSQ